MKKYYKPLECKIMIFEQTDIVTASVDGNKFDIEDLFGPGEDFTD
jgi:hypothetical protein